MPDPNLSDYFDREADGYDDRFTSHPIGRRYREIVWRNVELLPNASRRLLDIGAGTGADAAHFAELGYAVTALEPSSAMLTAARARTTAQPFETIASDLLGWEPDGRQWPVVLSNFGALNCIAPDARMAERLASLVEPGGYLAAVVMGRFCLWETAYFALHADARAFRRWRGRTVSTVSTVSTVNEPRLYYPSAATLLATLAPWFGSTGPATGIGVMEPPSYAFHLHDRWPRLFDAFARVDAAVAGIWPFNRIADHYLLILQRTF